MKRGDEEWSALERQAAAGQLIAAMVESPGWKEVILPHFEESRESHYEGFLKCDTFEDFLRIRAGAVGLRSLIGLCQRFIDGGQAAQSQMRAAESEDAPA